MKAALYLRALVRVRAGLETSAGWELQLARSMLGGCGVTSYSAVFDTWRACPPSFFKGVFPCLNPALSKTTTTRLQSHLEEHKHLQQSIPMNIKSCSPALCVLESQSLSIRSPVLFVNQNQQTIFKFTAAYFDIDQ